VKILVAHNAYHYRGGEDTVVDAEVSLLRSHGHDVLLYRRDNADILHMPRWRAALDTFWSGRTVDEIDKLQCGFKPDLIHAHNTFPLISPSLYGIAEKLRVPVIQTLHNFRLVCPQAMLMRNGRSCTDCVGHWPWRGVLHRCYRSSLAQSAVTAAMLSTHRIAGTWHHSVTRYIVLNQTCRDIFAKGGLPAERMRIKPNFVEQRGVPDWKAREGALFIGRLSPEKGLETLARAMQRLPGIRVSVYGKGPLQSMVEQCEGLDYHGFEGGETLRQRVAKAAFLVMPSTGIESFGLAAIEAFASGTPVIASRQGGLREIVEHRKNGLLVAPGDAEDLAWAINYASTHPQEMLRMGMEAYQSYLAHYTPERNYATLMGIYDEALVSPPSSFSANLIHADARASS
jgi:glycosyltransferase involved in cell wall biosynthesis